MSKISKLIKEMIEYYRGDAKRIQHFIKVHSLAKIIGESEELNNDIQEILEIAAVVHDIGIKISEEKYGSCNGKYQEQEGPLIAKEMLQRLGYENNVIERVCYLVGHHHTYNNIDGIDYQILVEADFLVNFYEDESSKETIEMTCNKIFKTNMGKIICSEMFGLR